MFRSAKDSAACLMTPVLILWVIGLSACMRNVGTHTVTDQPSLSKNSPVAVLVNRMHSSSIVLQDISLKTDYSLRLPSGTGVDNKDIYIGDESRMKTSLAQFPYHYYGSEKRYQRYYKDITPEVTDAVRQLLSDKGYQAVDLRKLSRGWPQPVSEMTIKDILQRTAGQIGALLVVHYEDYGDMRWQNMYSWSEMKGFNELHYAAALFDVSTRERLLFYSPVRHSLHALLIHDPEIRSNPELHNRIQYKSNGGSGASSGRMGHDFSDSELVAFALKYVCQGFSFMLESDWALGRRCRRNPTLCQGLADVIP